MLLGSSWAAITHPHDRKAEEAFESNALAGRAQAEVAVPVVHGRRALVHAAWRRSARPALAGAFAAGERSLAGAVVRVGVVEVAGLDPAWLADVDAPEDLGGPHCGP